MCFSLFQIVQQNHNIIIYIYISLYIIVWYSHSWPATWTTPEKMTPGLLPGVLRKASASHVLQNHGFQWISLVYELQSAGLPRAKLSKKTWPYSFYKHTVLNWSVEIYLLLLEHLQVCCPFLEQVAKRHGDEAVCACQCWISTLQKRIYIYIYSIK